MDSEFHLLDVHDPKTVRNVVSCESGSAVLGPLRCAKPPTEIPADRFTAIPTDAVKITPETDLFPSVLHSLEIDPPVSNSNTVNTAGAVDSPFISPDGGRPPLLHPRCLYPAGEASPGQRAGIFTAQHINGALSPAKQVFCSRTEGDSSGMDTLSCWRSSVVLFDPRGIHRGPSLHGQASGDWMDELAGCGRAVAGLLGDAPHHGREGALISLPCGGGKGES